MIAPIATTILLLTPCHAGPTHSCYDYPTRSIHLNSFDPYVVTHELGHAYYFTTLDQATRNRVKVGDTRVREEEAFADTFSACVLGRGPRWMRTTGYHVTIGLERFKRICRLIRKG